MIRVGIVGYGNLGKSLGYLVDESDKMELVGYFSRREIEGNLEVKRYGDIKDYKDKIDILFLCGSSDHDIEIQGPELVRDFNTIDCFDNHKHIYDYYQKMDKIAKESEKVSLISTGWDPGLFSLARTLFEAVLPKAKTYTFWGKGISQGHSAAVRAIEGVKDAAQYTIPREDFLESVREGAEPEFTPQKAHLREVFVVVEDGADKEIIEGKIKTMPDYFEGYETKVNFVSQEDLNKNHKGMPHGGRVIREGENAKDQRARMEFILDLDRNPDFTAAVALAYGKAVYKLYKEKSYGAKTVLDIPISMLIDYDREYLLKHMI